MQNDISVATLCLELEQKLMEVWSSELTLECYRKVLAEYHNFGIIHRRTDFLGEIIWPGVPILRIK